MDVMKTTLTLDDDIAAKLRAEARRTGKSFKVVVNEFLRVAVNSRPQHRPTSRFQVETRDLGQLQPGLTLDNVAELLEQVEGPASR
jgi:plasmid stability protein